MSRIVCIVLIFSIGVACVRKQKQVSDLPVRYGYIERIYNVSSGFVDARNVDVWLPPGYHPKNQYPVIYLHDGQMLFDAQSTFNNQEWGVDEVVGRLIKEGKISPCIVVGIWNNGEMRHAEYLPQKPFETLALETQDSIYKQKRGDHKLFTAKLQSDDYLRFIVEELKPLIDDRYSTLSDMENTHIGGSSMGGLISIYALCEYPNVFASAICMSTHWPGTFDLKNNPIPDAFVSYLDDNLPDKNNHRIYFDHGTIGLDSLYPKIQDKVDYLMKQKGYNKQNWMSHVEKGADHNEEDWNKRLDRPFRFLLEIEKK